MIVPCHRVVGSDGSLTDYGGGPNREQQLLDFERGTVVGATSRRPAHHRDPWSNRVGATQHQRMTRRTEGSTRSAVAAPAAPMVSRHDASMPVYASTSRPARPEGQRGTAEARRKEGEQDERYGERHAEAAAVVPHVGRAGHRCDAFLEASAMSVMRLRPWAGHPTAGGPQPC
ncbi:MGMT family protein [Streptomyces thermoviolaceus]|uniref:MGMT family protein n=1 Tax=Streptomyces thermoviolaceus TaxID=1952 RepID=UPI003570BA34